MCIMFSVESRVTKGENIYKRTKSEKAKAVASKMHFLNWDQWLLIRSNVIEGEKACE